MKRIASPSCLFLLILLVIAWFPGCDQDRSECKTSQVRDGTTVCGLNDEGVFLQACEQGHWVDTQTCTGEDECTEDSTQVGQTPCNDTGFLFQECTSGTWADTSECSVASSLEMPLLAAGQHLGMITGFELLPSQTRTLSENGRAQAVARGMSIGRVHLDWKDLEPTRGVTYRNNLEAPLLALENEGLQSFVAIYVVDTEGEDLLPADLSGLPLDSPVVQERYQEMLDWAVPLIVEHGGFVLSVGNEPDPHLLEHPEDTAALAGFIAAARYHVHTLESQLAVTITLTLDSLTAAHGPVLIAESDVVTFNYYPITFSPTVLVTDTSMSAVQEMIDAMLAAAGEKQVLIQELGCPAGYDDVESLIGSSEAIQAGFLANVVEVMTQRPALRAAVWFQQVDWSADLVAYYTEIFEQEGLPPLWIDAFEEFLRTVGFLKYEDGAERTPGWEAFLSAQDLLYSSRNE
ncbi:hypothetical protein KKF84_22650 [Myxococcota bacterium]|nr:hypothetical protein [Myxococcota bacterium]